jgi:hypothetical protein
VTVASSVVGYRSGESCLVLVSRKYKPSGTKPGVIYAHGAGGTCASALDTTTNVLPTIADAGYPVGAFDLGTPTVASGTTSGPFNWGNDNAITSMGAAKTWLQTTDTSVGRLILGCGANTAKFHIYATSMGALATLNYLISLSNPASVCASVSLAVPVLDLDDIYQNNKQSWQASIASAYGVSFPTGIPNLTTHSPVAYSAANLAKLTMPIKIWGSSDDPVASNTALCKSWAATAPNATVADLGAVGHTGSLPFIPATDVLAFISAH